MTVELKQRSQFIEVLNDYQPSEAALEVLKNIPLVIMLGISGAGRNTIINHLVNSGRYHFVVSDTTRPPKIRDGRLEQDGVHYNFRSEAAILKDLIAGNYLEAELIHNQQVSGISIEELQKAAGSDKIPINEVEYGGTEAIKKLKPDTYFYFVVPPSYKEWLYRLQGRERMSTEEMANRMATAKRILEKALVDTTFTFIENDSSHASAELMNSIVTSQNHQYDDTSARDIALSILKELNTSTH